jgi:MFS family permease
MGVLSLFFSTGAFVTAALAWLLTSYLPRAVAWRALCGILGGSCLIVAALRLVLPETPAFEGAPLRWSCLRCLASRFLVLHSLQQRVMADRTMWRQHCPGCAASIASGAGLDDGGVDTAVGDTVQ